MKKLTSFITAGFLAAVSAVPAPVSALNYTPELITAGSKSESVVTSMPYTPDTTTTTTDVSSSTTVRTTALIFLDEQSVFAELCSCETAYIQLGDTLDLDKIMINLSVYGKDHAGNISFTMSPECLNYSFSIGSGKHSELYTYDTSEVDTSKAGTYFIHVQTIPQEDSQTFVLENSKSNLLTNRTYKMQFKDEYTFDIPVNVYDPSMLTTEVPVSTEAPATTQPATGYSLPLTTTATYTTTTPIVEGDIFANFYLMNDEYNIPVGESFNINDVTLELFGFRYSADGSEYASYQEVNYNFTIGSGMHSGCYTYDETAINTSVTGRHLIYIYPVDDATDTFTLENSTSEVLPNGTYKMRVQGGVTPMILRVNVYDPTNTMPAVNTQLPYYTTSRTTTPFETTSSTTYLSSTAPSQTTTVETHDSTRPFFTTGDTETTTTALYGDANEDGKITIADAAAIIQYMGNPDKYQLTEQGFINADCYNTGDGVTLLDALAIQQLEAKIIFNLPVSK